MLKVIGVAEGRPPIEKVLILEAGSDQIAGEALELMNTILRLGEKYYSKSVFKFSKTK